MTLRGSHLRVFTVSRRANSFITTPIFYANAAPHIGHLYTTVLADAAHRWSVLKEPAAGGGHQHLLSTGTDEHGIKILRSAEAAGKQPQQFCDDVSGVFRRLFRQFDIQHSHYIRTTEAHHKRAVQHVWKLLKSKDLIYRDVYRGWYSVVDECFYADKEVETTSIGGEAVKVVRGTQTRVEWVEEDNYMFRLSRFRGDIKQWLTQNDIIRPKHYLPAVLRLLDDGDGEDLSVSRCRKRLPWGIEVPEDAGQTIYVWLDALVNYLSICGYPTDEETMRTAWPPTCQIIGKDIMKFHAIYWPAFLLGAGLPLPRRLFVHGHWLVDGTKMSKSVGNVVDPFEAAQQFTTEGLRYFLLRQGVPQDDFNFTATKALQVINSDLVNNVGNLLSRGTVAKLNPAQTYPRMQQSSLPAGAYLQAEPLIHSLNEIREQTAGHFDQLLFYKGIEALMAVVKQANGFFQAQEPWKMAQGEQLSSTLHLCYETVRIAAVLLQPVVPHYAGHALDRLGIAAEQRGLETAHFDAEGGFAGRKLGEERGPFMQRLKL